WPKQITSRRRGNNYNTLLQVIKLKSSWNGCIKDGADGSELIPTFLNDLHPVTGFDKAKFQIDLIGRYPSIVQQISCQVYACVCPLWMVLVLRPSLRFQATTLMQTMTIVLSNGCMKLC
ncbi:unnamed protein product, partial [Brassica napus]